MEMARCRLSQAPTWPHRRLYLISLASEWGRTWFAGVGNCKKVDRTHWRKGVRSTFSQFSGCQTIVSFNYHEVLRLSNQCDLFGDQGYPIKSSLGLSRCSASRNLLSCDRGAC